MDILTTTGLVIGIIVGIMSIIGAMYKVYKWSLNFKKKSNFDTEKRFSAEDVNALTEQARESEKKLVEENLENFGADLEKSGNHAGAKKLAEAQEALANNELSKADKLFAEIEEGEELTLPKFADVSFARGYIAEEELRWKDAAQHYTRAAEIDPCFETLLRAQSLALAIGDYDSALPLGKAAKKIAIADYGKDSAEYASSLNDLGGVYQEKGLDTEAEPLYNEALIIRKKKLGINHPATSCILNNLAEIYHKRGDTAKAEQFFKQALEIDTKALGEEHPETATDMNNLAALYREQKRYVEAEFLYQRALTIRKKMLGKNHPDIAKTYNNLAVLYEEQGRYEEVEPFYLQAIQIFETIFGDEHLDTKKIKRNYETFKKAQANTEDTTPQ